MRRAMFSERQGRCEHVTLVVDVPHNGLDDDNYLAAEVRAMDRVGADWLLVDRIDAAIVYPIDQAAIHWRLTFLVLPANRATT